MNTDNSSINGHLISAKLELEEAKEQLRQFSKRKAEFLQKLSDELRTPLSSLKEMVSIVFREIPGELNGNQRKYLQLSLKQLECVERVIGDMFNAANIEMGRLTMRRKPLDIKSLLVGLNLTYKKYLTEKKLTLDFKVDPNLGKVFADPDKIVQVIANLLDNVFKHSAKGGRISLSARNIGDMIEIEIAGTDIEKSGLGVAVSRKVIEIHGGELEFKTGSKGNFIVFTLPVIDFDGMLRLCIDDILKVAEEKDAVFSVIAVSVDFKKNRKHQKVFKVCNEIEHAIQQTLRRASDMVFGEAEKNKIIIIAEVDKNGASGIRNRVVSTVGKVLSGFSDLEESVGLKFDIVTYPEDGSDSETLLGGLSRI